MSEPRDERSELDPTLREELRRRARPAAPPAVRERARAAFLDGEIRATSGTRPLPFRLRVATEEAVVSLAGTTFAVIRDDEATCVCLYQGAIHVLARGEASPTPVAVRTRRYIYRDGRPSAEEPLSDMECMKLEMLLQAGP